MEGLRIILIAALFTASVDGACKTKDASWNRGIKPRISQPQRNDPAKVVIDWSRSIKNARCVDSYNVRIFFCFAFPDALIIFQHVGLRLESWTTQRERPAYTHCRQNGNPVQFGN